MKNTTAAIQRALTALKVFADAARSAAECKTFLKALVDLFAGSSSRLERQNELAETCSLEPTLHNIECSQLLGHEKNLLVINERRGDQVDD